MKIPSANISTLENGIRIVTEEIPYLRSVSIGLMVGAGSSIEQKKETGISHLIEHMTFKGTPKRNAFQIAQALDSVGGKLNAFTGKEYTVYYAVVQDKHFDIAADVLSDIYLNPLNKAEDLDLERNVVLEEIRMYEDTPDEQIHDIFISKILKGHSIGNSTLGTMESVSELGRDDILDFRKKYYSPDNLIVSVAGNIETKAVVETVSNWFLSDSGKNKKTKQPLPEVSKNIFLKNKKTEQAHIIIGTKGTSQMDEDRYIFSVLENAVAGSMSSRLFQEIREKRALAYSIYSFNQGFKDIGLFGVYAGTKKENFEQVVSLILKELKDIKRSGLKKEEIERAKEFIKGSIVLSLESSSNRMNYSAKSLFYYDRIVPIDEIFEKVDKVSNDDIIALTNDRFRNDYMNLIVIGDFEKLPVSEIKI